MRKVKNFENLPRYLYLLSVCFIAAGVAIICLVGVENHRYGNSIIDFEVAKIIAGVFFITIGVLFGIYAIVRTIKVSKYNKLEQDTSAYITTAQFISAKTSFGSKLDANMPSRKRNYNVYKTIRYSYIDEKGKEHLVKSTLSFTPNQIDYLQENNEFKIKCKGNNSVIIETLPDAKEDFKRKPGKLF